MRHNSRKQHLKITQTGNHGWDRISQDTQRRTDPWEWIDTWTWYNSTGKQLCQDCKQIQFDMNKVIVDIPEQ